MLLVKMKWNILFLFTLVLGAYTVLANDDDVDDEAVVEDEYVEEADDDDIKYVSPDVKNGQYHFAEHFDDIKEFEKRWQRSEATKDGIDADIAKYDGIWSVETPQREKLKGDLGLVLKSKAKHAAISAQLTKPFEFVDKPLVVQYEVTLQDGQECGGAYLKLLSYGRGSENLRQFTDKTPYTIMFGPDKCGNDQKLHFIFRHQNPKNFSFSEKHCKKSKDRLDDIFVDKLPHLYTLIVYPQNLYTIKVDHKIVNEGSLLEDFTPPVNPPAEIDDPNDKKPEDWDEREQIPDPDAMKPDDWNEDAPKKIPDPNAVKPLGWLDEENPLIPDSSAKKPEDWDTEMDGEWEPPLITNAACEQAPGCGEWKPPQIDNPEYKGKWRAPMIDNPNYKGKWKAKRIPNPDYFVDEHPYKMTKIGAIGFELWSMSKDILFDNIIITDDIVLAESFAAKTFDLKRKKIDKDSESLWSRLLRYTHDNPWIWAVYVLAIGLPLVLIIFFCCSPSSPKDKDEQHPKKTDVITEDIIEEVENEEELGEGDAPKPSTSKSSLEESTASEGTPEQSEEASGDAPRRRKVRKD
ncbi:calnexin-like isoform X2 [Chrysoperla carnea]|uniref:calnexin-like isoform X2 n=1 Tax=Chrysoperla carnea TaxID=189513 RepID=UPI001D05F5CE|nr:calnexin-like isoform X2 [Chrysoperla carnea]